jgi:hypothetical protein
MNPCNTSPELPVIWGDTGKKSLAVTKPLRDLAPRPLISPLAASHLRMRYIIYVIMLQD